MAHKLPTLPSAQRGSASSIVSTIILFVLVLKLAIAIAPAQIEDRTVSATIAKELKKSNMKKEGKSVFLKNLNTQLGLNSIDLNPEEILTFTNETTGNLTVHKKYQVESEFFPTVFITNKFEGDIRAADAKE